MKRLAAIVVVIGAVAGVSMAHAMGQGGSAPTAQMGHAGHTPAMRVYHYESSVRAVRTAQGYSVISQTAQHNG